MLKPSELLKQGPRHRATERPFRITIIQVSTSLIEIEINLDTHTTHW